MKIKSSQLALRMSLIVLTVAASLGFAPPQARNSSNDKPERRAAVVRHSTVTPNNRSQQTGLGISANALELNPKVADLSWRFQHIEPLVTADNLIAHWAFDEGSGYEFRDSSGRNQTGYITGFNWNTTDSGLTTSFRGAGKRAGGVRLNGTQWIEAQANKTATRINNQITVAVWIKIDDDATQSIGQTIIAQRHAASGYTLAIGNNSSFRFTVRDPNGGEQTVTSKVNTARRETWTHVAAVCNAATNGLAIYVDGALSNTLKTATPLASGINVQANFRVGCADGDTQCFAGWLDEATIYESALDANAINELYLTGLPKIYSQTRETIDAGRTIWSAYHGNQPIPHPIEADTVFTLDFNNSLVSNSGIKPVNETNKDYAFVPSAFGGGLVVPRTGFAYPLSAAGDNGTLETWLTLAPEMINATDSVRETKIAEQVVFCLEGAKAQLKLLRSGGKWKAVVQADNKNLLTLESEPQANVSEILMHVALAWRHTGGNNNKLELTLYLNGVDVARSTVNQMRVPLTFNRRLIIGGEETGNREAAEAGFENAVICIDDLRLSSEAREWGEICPRGHMDTEAASLDMRDDFNYPSSATLMLWRSGVVSSEKGLTDESSAWSYKQAGDARQASVIQAASERQQISQPPNRCASTVPSVPQFKLKQATERGFHTLYHLDAYGLMSGMEASVSFENTADGWAGVFVNSSAPNAAAFSGYTFSINARLNRLRLAQLLNGSVVSIKTLEYDFAFKPQQTYTLTLTLTGEKILRGYLDGNNLISLHLPKGANTTTDATTTGGYAGLFTEDSAAAFDAAHFTALTPSQKTSRLIQSRVFTQNTAATTKVSNDALTFNAFRWHKRQGLLPWQYTAKNPQPPGAIFGADDDVARPNPSKSWRAEDSANSSVIGVDGTIFYFMRGNSRANNIHGAAQIGALTAAAQDFDGIHFDDASRVITGHTDIAPPACRDGAPNTNRYLQLQINDEGAAYIGKRKIIVVAREFRNAQPGKEWYRRLVFGTYDIDKRRWDSSVVNPVAWSVQSNPASCDSVYSGIDATPEITALRHPTTDEYEIFLYHMAKYVPGVSPARISGLRYDGQQLNLNSRYPQKEMLEGYGDRFYGQRVLFDNGIYYMNFNAGSTVEKLRHDWCDRFKLATSLHPYNQAWTESADNSNPSRPYFARGAENDFDNAAIWQGAMLKFHGRYYMYYENYHNVENVNRPYEDYNHIQTGSRVGFATAN